MKKLLLLVLVSAFAAAGLGQEPRRSSALQSMVDAERAFARMSEEQGTRPSFMAFIAEDGILFRPTAVKGKQWMIEHPLPPSDKRPLLSWQPTFADIARAGDMGYTTGPWEYKDDIHDAKPVAFGNFLTVWKKQGDGSWKSAIDLGISNPKPDQAATPWQLPRDYIRRGGIGTTSKAKAETNALRARDREFSAASATLGAQKAFVDFAAREVRVLRNGKPPFGKADAEAALLANPVVWTWEPAFADVSRSGDLGYTYGTYNLVNNSAPTTLETGNYFRIWKKEGNTWKVVADLTDPVQDEKN